MIPRIFLLILCLSVSVAAQTPAAQTPNDEVKNAFQAVNNWVVKSAEMVPADKFNYKPTDTVRTFGQLIAHITDSYNYFCAHGVGNKIEYSEAGEKGRERKSVVKGKSAERKVEG